MKGDILHILNRGVEKRKIFLDEENYLRFVYNLYDFNNKNLTMVSYHDRRRYPTSLAIRKPSNELVDILCWCAIPNHFHILVQEKIEGGAWPIKNYFLKFLIPTRNNSKKILSSG